MNIRQISQRQDLFESVLLADNTYQNFYRIGTVLIERRMTDPEIQKLFKDVETRFSAAGSNRTMIGRGKDAVTDVVSAVNRAYQGVADKISKSGPVSGFDATVDKLTDRLKSSAGGDSGAVMQAVKKYREFAKRHPVMQGAIYAGLIALAGLSGAGLGGAALLGGIKAFDKMLLGNKASSALWSGFLTGATAYGLSQATQAFQGAQAAPGSPSAAPADVGEVPGVTTISGDLPTYRIQAGDTLSQIAQQNKVSVQDLMQANPDITDPNRIIAGQTLEIPAPTGNPVYQGGVGAGGPTATPTSGGNAAQGLKVGATPAPGANIQVPDISGAEQAAQAAQGAPRDFVYDPVNGEMVPSDSAIAQAIRSGERVAAREAQMPKIKVQRMPMREMIDRKMTVWNWQLQENLTSQHKRSLNLNRKGVQHLFRVAESYTSLVHRHLAEYRLDGPAGQKISQKLAGKQSTVQPAQAQPAQAQPAQAQQPEYLRPSRPGAPVAEPTKPGIMSRIGQGFRDFGRQLTTKVTAEKLNTNWKVAGSPTDSDKLYAFLQQQGVPAAIASDIYQQLNLPVPGSGDQDSADAGTAPTSTQDVSTTSGAADSAVPAAADSATAPKVAASDIVNQLKSIWEPIISNQENPIGSPAVKAYIKDMWMRAGGTKAMESRRGIDPMISRVVAEVKARHKQTRVRVG